MVKETEYYERLRVSPDCTQEEIKQSWLKIVRLQHPDQIDIMKKFGGIVKAHSVLCDPEKRQIYDKYGKLTTEHIMRIPAIKAVAFVTTDEIQRGKTKTYKVEKFAKCNFCHGTGLKKHKCQSCHGVGQFIRHKIENKQVETSRKVCDQCSGAGQIKSNSACEHCQGERVVKCFSNLIDIKLSSNMRPGGTAILEHCGNEWEGYENGHIEVTIEVQYEEFPVDEGDSNAVLVSSDHGNDDEGMERNNEEEIRHERADELGYDGNQEREAESGSAQISIVDSRSLERLAVLSPLTYRSTVKELSTIQSEIASAKTSTSFSQQFNSSDDSEDQDSDIEVASKKPTSPNKSFPGRVRTSKGHTSKANINAICRDRELTSSNLASHGPVAATTAEGESSGKSGTGKRNRQNLPAFALGRNEENSRGFDSPTSQEVEQEQQEDRNPSEGESGKKWAGRLRARDASPDMTRKVVKLTRRKNHAEVSDAANQPSSQKKSKKMDPANSS